MRICKFVQKTNTILPLHRTEVKAKRNLCNAGYWLKNRKWTLHINFITYTRWQLNDKFNFCLYYPIFHMPALSVSLVVPEAQRYVKSCWIGGMRFLNSWIFSLRNSHKMLMKIRTMRALKQISGYIFSTFNSKMNIVKEWKAIFLCQENSFLVQSIGNLPTYVTTRNEKVST